MFLIVIRTASFCFVSTYPLGMVDGQSQSTGPSLLFWAAGRFQSTLTIQRQNNTVAALSFGAVAVPSPAPRQRLPKSPAKPAYPRKPA
jgi:hypothetical protein